LSVTLTAANCLADNNYTTTDIPTVAVERIIDKAISYFNLRTGRSVNLMAGTPESKTTVVQAEEYGVLEAIITCMLREAKKTSLSNSTSTGSGASKSVNIGAMGMSESSTVSSAISAAQSINSEGNTVFREFITEGLRSLREVEVSYG
jgi:hypothetical protein